MKGRILIATGSMTLFSALSSCVSQMVPVVHQIDDYGQALGLLSRIHYELTILASDAEAIVVR